MLTTVAAAALASIVFTTVDVRIENTEIAPPDPGIVPLIATSTGTIQRIHVQQGSLVSQGDPIVQLQSHDLLVKRRTLESRIHQRETGAAGRTEMAELYRQLENCQLELNSRTLVSPADGQVIWLGSFRPGDTLRPGTAVAAIAADVVQETIDTAPPMIGTQNERLVWLILRRMQGVGNTY